MFEWLSESVWGYPIIAAVHVLGLAWFGAMVLTSPEEFRKLKRVGLAVMLASGALLFGMHAARYSASTSFRIKMLLLALVLGLKLPRAVTLALWVAIIVASRGIAFY